MTTTQEIKKPLNDYRAWLKDKTTLREVNGQWVEITTPYLDGTTRPLQVYARADNGGYGQPLERWLLEPGEARIQDLRADICLRCGKLSIRPG